MSHRRTLALLGALGSLAATGLSATPVQAAVSCDRYVGIGGSDSGAGTESSPYGTVQHLADGLQPGQTGCLLAGTYKENLRIDNPGFTLTSAPGIRATITGRMRLLEHASDVTITRLNLDGANTEGSGSPVVLADRATFSYNDITNENSDICMIVGALGWSGWADKVVRDMTIAHNRIHNCGVLPATNKHHGLYIENTDGLKILDNVIFDNVDRGIQLFPKAVNTEISGNIIDGNGENIIFGGDGESSSSHTVVSYNIITNSRLRAGVESWYPDGTAPGVDNVVQANCMAGNSGGNVDLSAGGFTAAVNVTADPRYLARNAKDFTIKTGSPCAAVLAGADPPTTAAALDGAGGPAVIPGDAPAPDPAPDPAPAPAPAPAPTAAPRIIVSNTDATRTTAGTAVVTAFVTISSPAATAKPAGPAPSRSKTVAPKIEVSQFGARRGVTHVQWKLLHTTGLSKTGARHRTKRMRARVRIVPGSHMIRLRVHIGTRTVLKRLTIH